MTLGVARGQRVEFGALFAGGPWFWRVVLCNILYGLMVLLGCIAFIIPGIYLAVRFWPATYFIVDRDCDVMQSFSLAGEHMEGNKLACIGVFFMGFLVAALGMLLFCVGFIFAYPVITTMSTIAYLMMTRQPIARPMR